MVMVNLRQIADRLGYHYNSVQTWWRAGEMPEPIVRFGDRLPVWRWEDVLEWALAVGKKPRPVVVHLEDEGAWEVRLLGEVEGRFRSAARAERLAAKLDPRAIE